MRKILFILAMIVAASTWAVPARRGLWRTIVTVDGDEVRVEMVGDELCHYWRTADGVAYTQNDDGEFVRADVEEMMAAVAEKRQAINAMRAARLARHSGLGNGAATRGIGEFQSLEGEKRGLVLLVQFADKAFTDEHTVEYYEKVLNIGGDAEKGYAGSVKQYFSDQSNGRFTINFDVYGIITLPQPYAYYGKDSGGEGNDQRFLDMVRTAVNTANTECGIDWSLYDWDNDSYVDQTFLLYAGYGQATKADDPDLIWPKEQSLSTPVTVGNKKVKVVACSNEINWAGGTGDLDSGIGTFCHEFAHCLGYPDTYDIDYNCSTHSMDYWDLMDRGAYNGNGFIPAPFTALEKMQMGWLTPTTLENNSEYTSMRPVSAADGGDVYVMRNPAHEDEFYLFENIQEEGWCSGLYKAKGMLITYVDYDSEAWQKNVVNCKKYLSITNHPRYTYMPADGSYELTKTSHVRGDLYPYQASGEPVVDLFLGSWLHGDKEECDIRLRDIRINSDGTMAFSTELATAITTPTAAPHPTPTYNLQGQRINPENYHGIMVSNGKKIIK